MTIPMLYRTQDLRRVVTPEPALVEVPPMNALAVEGTGAPDLTRGHWHEAVQALYAVAYALRSALKREGLEEKVGPLEGLWSHDPVLEPERVRWTALIVQPEAVTDERLQACLSELRRKKGARLPALDRVRLLRLEEGLCVQALHLGPFSTEAQTLERMYALMKQQGLEWHGDGHHEIYLSDLRRVPPERRRTVLRQPVRAVRER
ncbi:hypothetical protein HNR42_000900 [Deinobacterium chartae]|uniref:GyrI-like small molecule binding domain-containing protein n=1 Tax=Deinobacterium chartae TaxID=521158 RepID=A0A841HXA7_9DEIO|nr:GyrI-like domain-containing protein [Deinobacterium chartae]MBB6097483.1 hypothetical protein [Deinobacterium chartae]